LGDFEASFFPKANKPIFERKQFSFPKLKAKKLQHLLTLPNGHSSHNLLLSSQPLKVRFSPIKENQTLNTNPRYQK